jgi:ParB/RepB/Spo0J family partition protein
MDTTENKITITHIDGHYEVVALSRIRKSPDNRKRFNELALTELASSIKAMGVAQPILIRPVTATTAEPEDFEIVAGERRFRASIIAGLTTIPAMIRVLSDVDAAKIRILENLQREDPHPLEEAEGYQILMQKHGYNADQLAEEVSKSRAYIYGRLKLCALAIDVREEFLDDKISPSIALLIARIPVPKLQAQALKEVLTPNTWPQQPLSYRGAQEHIKQRYMLDLTQAIFPIDDAKLLASAGACGKCPKRAGNQPEVFTDISADVCTDPDCFAEKRAAHHTRIIVIANKKGIPVLEGDELMRFNRDKFSEDSELVPATLHLHYFSRNAPKTENDGTPSTLLDLKAIPSPAAYLKSADGTVEPVYKRTEMQLALEKAGVCETVQQHEERKLADAADQAKRPANIKQAAEEQDRQARIGRAKVETNFRVALYRKLRQRGEAGFSLASLREFAKLLVIDDNNYSIPDDLIGDVYPFERGDDAAVLAYIDQASLPEVQMILVDLAIGESLCVESYDIDDLDDHNFAEGFRTLEKMAKHEGIDPRTVRKELEMETTEPAELAEADFQAFIRVNPTRVNELKDHLVDKRPHLLSALEQAAKDQGLTYTPSGFAHMGEANLDAGSTDVAASLGGDETDSEHLADAMIETPKAAPKKSTKKAKAAPAGPATPTPAAPTLSPAAAWPFPKSKTAALPAVAAPATITTTEKASV